MSTKIVIIRLRELIYTAIFVGLGIFLIILLIFMFNPKKQEKSEPTMKYIAGVYTSSIMLNDQPVNIEVVVDDYNVNSVRIVNLDETIETMWPLVKPSLENIATQLYEDKEIQDVLYSQDQKYTSILLLNGIEKALEKAEPILHN